MTATTTTAVVPIQPAFSDAERLALAGFLIEYRGRLIPAVPQLTRT